MLNKELIIKDLAKLLEMDISQLSDDFRLDTSANWDSLTMLSLVGAVDLHYKKNIFVSEILKCQTVNDLHCLVSESRVSSIASEVGCESA